MTDDQKAAMLDELIAMASMPEIKADEFTIADYMERAGVSYTRADREVEALLKGGVVTRRRAMCDGRRVWAYKRAEA